MPFTEVEIEKCTVSKGDLLVCEGGDIGRAAIWNRDEDIRIQNHIHRLRPYDKINCQFYYYMLYLYKLNGKINGNGIGLQGLSSNALHSIIVPLPPINEQVIITNRLEQIFSLVADIETKMTDLSMVSTAIKSKILDLAIHGKLVPQNQDDEPASVLLERIKAEKEELIKQGKIKRDKKESVIFKGEDNSYYEKISSEIKNISDEIPFNIPDSWSWCRFGTLTINRDNERKPVSSSNRKKIDKIYDYYGASGVIDKMDQYLFDERLLLIGEDGANLLTRSKPIAFFADGKYWVNNHAHCIDATNKQYLEYLCYFINAINLEHYVTGAAQPKMNQDNMNRILVSLPPLHEQNRILSAINKTIALIDEIEKSLN